MKLKLLPMTCALAFAGFTQIAQSQIIETCNGIEPDAAGTIDGSEAIRVGSINPNNGFPLTMQDTDGHILELCLDGDPTAAVPIQGVDVCFFDPIEEGNAFSEQVGFGPEAFWWLADSGLEFADGGRAVLVQGIEAAWVAEVPQDGEQFPFTRLRIRVDIPEPGQYIVTHPYGQIVYDIAPGDEGTRAINDSFDIPITVTNGDHESRVGPILTWDTFDGTGITYPDGSFLAGYVGDIGVEHTVTGSPCGTNYFSVTPPANVDLGAGLGAPVTNDLFIVQGKLATALGVTIDRVTYNRASNGNGRIDVLATSFPGQELHVTGIGNQDRIMVEDPGVGTGFSTGRYMARMSFNVNSFVPGIDDIANLITVTNAADEAAGNDTAQTSNAVDRVTITKSTFTTADTWLELRATSDDSAVQQTIQFFDQHGNLLGEALSGDTLMVHPVVPPSYIEAVSTGGGSETRQVQISGPNVWVTP